MSDDLCELCDGTGTMSWTQPVTTADGTPVLAGMTHPCVCPSATSYRFPAAERGSVVDPDGTGGAECGNVAAANRMHRTDWSRPGGA